jgi:dTDP-glucose 4,6-dehydratase
MKIMVTGAAGFIGQHLNDELEQAGHTVVGVDIAWGRDHDVRNPFNVRAALLACEPDVVVHLAAKVGRLFGEDDVRATCDDNAGMTATVAQVCGEHGARVAYASTSEVYGDWGDEFCREDDPFTRIPHNAYGLSKRWGEEACRLYAPDGLTVMRFSMPYGPGLPAGRGRAALINFLYNALHGLPITVHRGSERSWCWIGDTVRAARMLIEGGHAGAFNIGRDDNAHSMRSVAEMACLLADASPDLIEEVDAPGRQTVVKRLSTDKIRALGWMPSVSLDEGMARTLAFVRTLPAPERAAVAA